MWVYQGVDFRCTMIQLQGMEVIPLDYNPLHFRYIYEDRLGKALIGVEKASTFWSQVVV